MVRCAGAGDGQELGEPLDDAEHDGVETLMSVTLLLPQPGLVEHLGQGAQCRDPLVQAAGVRRDRQRGDAGLGVGRKPVADAFARDR